MSNRFTALLLSSTLRLRERPRDDRGDVPGWVMVTVMSAAVVAVLIPFAGDELKALLSNAMDTVRQ